MCRICPKDILPEALWLVNMHFGKFQSRFYMICFQPTVVSSSVYFGSNSDVWCDLTLMYLDLGVSPLISFEVVLGSLVTIRIIHLFNLSSIFLLRPPRPGRLATVPWTLNF